jgi:hypothetical protein
MFREERLDAMDEEFAAVARQSYEVLEGAIRAATDTPPGTELSDTAHGYLVATWSLVHGFAHLALGSQLRDSDGKPIPADTLLQTLLPQVLQQWTGEKKTR